ncbi:MAG: hypothetical protein Q8835_03275 [Sweet potato little leaf phytoplasma]|nr:hypothetical protein [Sweet potato little leaf phytoplasma]
MNHDCSWINKPIRYTINKITTTLKIIVDNFTFNFFFTKLTVK